VEVTRIETKKKTVKVTYSKLCESAKTAYGALINVMREAKQLSDSEIVDLLIKIDEVPRSLKRATGVTSFTERESYVTNEQGQTLCHA
jgi:DNA relaxase NicK